ncbi:MAG: class I SAM-dependent methyltransferase [Acidobacteria bacterium]|nr:MAG: class I SAM-dependent methyltransferase [Acidobacteriota bacterium]REJ98955.1 MAG: class I SAM-dependent methyltransferase [Acidobacteriota bacterium]REK16325.1 MAG: class I SAM-dependent methyltransferase [Acidobacteriota bacterium]REK44006.1 MAG: class I SAM-dependent methyltransferase [Acidobacteriota bacterium]
MAENGPKTRYFYDRIADAHNVALRMNGYRASVARYLRSIAPDIGPESLVLDAGSGTGIITMGLYAAGYDPARTVTLDLSRRSLKIGLEQFGSEANTRKARISAVQGNVLQIPFADSTFDLVLSCGVLEYVPLDEGLSEFARVMRKGAKLVLIPVKPSIMGSVLEFLYKFKTHPLSSVRREAGKHFRIAGEHEFSLTEVMGWSKIVFLLEKE